MEGSRVVWWWKLKDDKVDGNCKIWSENRYLRPAWHTCSCCHRVTILKYMFRLIFSLDQWLLVVGTYRASHFLPPRYDPQVYVPPYIFVGSTVTGRRYIPRFTFWVGKQVPADQDSGTHCLSYFCSINWQVPVVGIRRTSYFGWENRRQHDKFTRA